MPNREANSHSMFQNGAGGLAAGAVTNLGNITLPAGGPWKIHDIWSYLAIGTAGAAEASMGHIRITSVSGDITPNPAPSRWPIAGIPSYLGAATGKPLCPVAVWPTALEAAGKAVLTFDYVNEALKTAADDIYCGVMFSKTIPVPRRAPFCDRVTAAIGATGANAVGTITLAEKATRIVAIGCDVLQDNVSTTAEELIGYFTLTSDDVDFAPSQWPWSFASSIGLATNHGLNNGILTRMHPVDMPVLGGARIDCAVHLLTGPTNDAQASVYLMYE